MRNVPTVDSRASLLTGLASFAAAAVALALLASMEDAQDTPERPELRTAMRAPRGDGPLGVGFHGIRDVERRKRLFVDAVLPLIRRENARIERERALAKRDPPGWLYRKYEVKPGDRKTLMRKIDVVPPSLAVAQAAVESGWGTSRFFQEANNLYGERTYDESAAGIAPREATGFRVAAFPSPGLSVRSYLHNLNSHDAYRTFRVERERLRREAAPSGLELAKYLTAYSERRQEYVRVLRRVIRDNALEELDRQMLARR